MGDHRDKQEEITRFPDGLSTEKLRNIQIRPCPE
jgi:hypothetical protein